MSRTIFSIKGGDRWARVVLVDADNSVFPTWWNRPAYFVTTSDGGILSCPDEDRCIDAAIEQANRVEPSAQIPG